MSDNYTEKVPVFGVELPDYYPLNKDVVGKARTFVDEFMRDVEGEAVYRAMGVQTDSIYGLFGKPGCLGKGTLIATPFGDLPIEQVTHVFSLDLNTKKIVIKPVIVLPTKKQVVEIELESGEIIKCSKKHPFYLSGYQERVYKCLNSKDYLIGYDKEELYRVWERDVCKAIKDRDKEILFEQVQGGVFKEEFMDDQRPTGFKKLYALGASIIRGRSKDTICRQANVTNEDCCNEGSYSSYYLQEIKEIWDKNKNLQGTSSNRGSKTRTSRKVIKEVLWRKQSPIYSWQKSRSKKQQKEIFGDSQAQFSLDLCKLSGEQNGNGLLCTSQGWEQSQQRNNKLNSIMSELSCEGTFRKRIKSIRVTSRVEEMFDLIVPGTNTFFLANGLLTHNCGKTLAVQAINNTMNVSILEKIANGENVTSKDFKLALLKYDIGRYGTAYINMGSRIVQSYFDAGFAIARQGIPVLLEMDEADALLGSRTSGEGHSEDKKVLETIMKNLQTAHDTNHVYVMMMSNLPESCDEASLRAGRIDKRITFTLPDLEERKAAYAHFIDMANSRAGYKVVRKAIPDKLAKSSEGFNYADMKQVIDMAIKQRAKEIILNRTDKIVPAGYVNQARIETELDKHKEAFYPKPEVIGFR